MKKSILILSCILLITIYTIAQDAKFYVNKATTVGTTCDCSTIKSIKVTIPIPSGVTTYDGYYLYMTLNSLDVPAYIYFEKKDIAAKLAGKKEYSAYLLKEDGGSDFTFDDNKFSKTDLCSTPRMWGMTEMEMEASGAGYKITGYHWEDKWNEYYKKWESTKTEDWDEGVGYGSGKLVITQRPLSEGFSDENEFITVKASNTDSSTYSISKEIEIKGALNIEDKSEDFQTNIYYAYFEDNTYTYDKLKEAIINSTSGKFQVGVQNPFWDLRSISLPNKADVAGKSSFSKTTINGTEYETIAYRQIASIEQSSSYGSNYNESGFYADFYIAKVGKYNVIIVSLTNEITEKIGGMSMMDKPTLKHIFKVSDENIKRIDKITEKWLNATTYKIN